MKNKIFLLIFVYTFLSTRLHTQNSADCYDNWLWEFSLATTIYENERGVCKGTYSAAYNLNNCYWEADVRYANAVESAADNYINCID